ncbi:DoxX family protein [Amycolatopsis taiwanensis]|uniref:Membrane protein n=1 Tax=Amycolatopsis taiwanensis TaxID=342230 RepID=A0A9W6VFI0_9PSEU|nr:DoxX family protein [Amycolatopsis taiwanensis]GLY66815.1 membrane protein [Amycolatopsis taiwanensis]
MTAVLFTATLLCIVANAFIAIADYLKAGFVLKNSAEVRVPVAALPYLATMKLAGAAGLVVGLVAVPWLGVAAGTGLILFFVGAVIAHLRARVFYNIAFPGFYLLLAVASLAYLTGVVSGS